MRQWSFIIIRSKYNQKRTCFPIKLWNQRFENYSNSNISIMEIDEGHGKVDVNGHRQCREDNSFALTCAVMNVLDF